MRPGDHHQEAGRTARDRRGDPERHGRGGRRPGERGRHQRRPDEHRGLAGDEPRGAASRTCPAAGERGEQRPTRLFTVRARAEGGARNRDQQPCGRQASVDPRQVRREKEADHHRSQSRRHRKPHGGHARSDSRRCIPQQPPSDHRRDPPHRRSREPHRRGAQRDRHAPGPCGRDRRAQRRRAGIGRREPRPGCDHQGHGRRCTTAEHYGGRPDCRPQGTGHAPAADDASGRPRAAACRPRNVRAAGGQAAERSRRRERPGRERDRRPPGPRSRRQPCAGDGGRHQREPRGGPPRIRTPADPHGPEPHALTPCGDARAPARGVAGRGSAKTPRRRSGRRSLRPPSTRSPRRRGSDRSSGSSRARCPCRG